MDKKSERELKALEARKGHRSQDDLEDWIRKYVAEYKPWNASLLLQRADELKIARELAMATIADQIEALKRDQN